MGDGCYDIVDSYIHGLMEGQAMSRVFWFVNLL